MSTGESWDVSRHTARCTSRVSVHWQCKRVPGLTKRRSAPTYAPCGSRRTLGLRYVTYSLYRVQGTTLLLDRALVREAEGLLADMMADPELPRHLLIGLRAVSDLLKSTDVPLLDASAAAGGFHRVKSSPVASLSDTSFGADVSDLPYAERPVYLPKVSSLSVNRSINQVTFCCHITHRDSRIRSTT